MPTPKEYQALLKAGCPWCGEALIIKQGKYGEFIACSEWCGFKKSISGRGEYPPAKAVKRVCPYKKCDGSGLIPLKKNSKVIPHAHIFCDCHPQYGIATHEHYGDVKPEDYDFPMSETFRAWAHESCGVSDPGYIPPVPPEPSPQVIVHRHSDMSKEDYDLLQQTARKANYLEKQVVELSRPKQKAQRKSDSKYGYKGITK